jgi:membrane-associated protein
MSQWILNFRLWFLQAIDLFLHLDVHLASLAANLGSGLYFLLFAVVFAETGLVVTPFLPGDSLLFAVGALAALPDSHLSLPLLYVLLLAASVGGDATNYWIGKKFGVRVYSLGDRWWIKQEHLEKTRKFYVRYGAKTIVIARFAPIIRTFAPFVAGIGEMPYRIFSTYNILGGFLWVTSFLFMGYFFGNLPSVKSHFHFVIVGIIFLSILPGIIAYVQSRRHRRGSARP